MRSILRCCYLFVVSALVTGCGYHAVSQDAASRFGEGKTVSIPIFANKTYRPNLENILLNYLVDEFARRKSLKVQEMQFSDYTLSGEILTYSKAAISFTGYDTIKEYRATMTLLATMRKNSTQKIVWRGNLSWSQDFPASTDIAIQQNSEDAAIQEICRRLAQQIYLKIMEDF